MNSDPVVCPAIIFSDLTIREFGTEKISIIGSFAQFNAPQFPFIAPAFHVTFLLTNIQGPMEQLPVTLRIEGKDTGHVIASTTGSISIPPTHTLADIAQIVFGIPPMQIPAPGRYNVHILVRNEAIAERPLFVKSIATSTTEKF